MGRRLKSTMLVSVWLSAGLDREKRRADRLAEECSRYEKRAAQGVSAANRAEAELETLRSARQLHGLQRSGCEDVRSSTIRAHQGVPCPWGDGCRQEAQRQQVDVQLHAQSAGASSEKLSQLQHDYLALVNAHDVSRHAPGLRPALSHAALRRECSRRGIPLKTDVCRTESHHL